ncbi:MAG: dihydroneopterin aldolase [Candidatus Marinimicrobia bacterium]|nr:dihydroneopterin aldolase [Candidatus Neomarinimicrobiota bacterium]
MGKIRLNNMQFYGYHGVHDSEKELGGKFEVDLELRTSLKKSIASDALADTIDYQAVYKIVSNSLEKNKFYLLEALAGHIAKSLLTTFAVDSVLIKVRKPHAPVKGVLDTVEVEIERYRSDYE